MNSAFIVCYARPVQQLVIDARLFHIDGYMNRYSCFTVYHYCYHYISKGVLPVMDAIDK